MQYKTRSRGFTLVELLVTVSIVALLTVLGLPSLRDTFERNAVTGHVNTFLGAVQFARGEAIKRGTTVKMCRSVGAESAVAPACAVGSGNASPGWATGWIIFVDRNDNGTVDAADILLKVQEALSSSGGVQADAATLVLLFRPTGMLAGTAGQFTFKSASGAATQDRRVCLSLQGRARIATDATTACSANDV